MNVLIPLADGVEEMEAVILVDVLRRAEWKVVVAGIKEGPVTASRGIRLLPEVTLSSIDQNEFEMLVIPGGANGVRRLCECNPFLEIVRSFAENNRWLAAICAGPLVLEAAGVLSGRQITSHPSVAEYLKSATVVRQPVVRDGRLLTSRGPGTAMALALSLVACVAPELVSRLAEAMVCGPEIKDVIAEISGSS